MKDKTLIELLKNSIPNDCCDFFDNISDIKANEAPCKKRGDFKIIIVTAFIIIVAVSITIYALEQKDNKKSPTEDTFLVNEELSKENSKNRKYNVISAACRVARPIVNASGEHRSMGGLMNTVYYGVKYSKDVLFRTLVSGNLKFEDFCEENGFLTTDGNAKKRFVDTLSGKYEIETATIAYDTAEYSAEEYLFVAELSKEQIKNLMDDGYFVELGIADGKSDVVTDSLEAIAEDGKNVLVEIVLDIDNFKYTDNEDFYTYGIRELSLEQMNESYVMRTVRSFADENSLEIVNNGSRFEVREDGDGYICVAAFAARMDKEKIYNVAKDERIRFMDVYS